MMRFVKGLNNNVAMIVNEQDQECIVIGKGISFKRKPGTLFKHLRLINFLY